MSISWKDFKQSIDGSCVHCSVRCILLLMLVAELDVMPSDAVTLYCKDNDIIALAKEPRSHQKFKHRATEYVTTSSRNI